MESKAMSCSTNPLLMPLMTAGMKQMRRMMSRMLIIVDKKVNIRYLCGLNKVQFIYCKIIKKI